MTDRFGNYRREWFAGGAGLRADVLAGIVVALALIPEAIGFSIIAGVDPRVGLYASVAIAIVISLVGGRPGMISAATAAVAVVVIPLVRDLGIEYLLAATIAPPGAGRLGPRTDFWEHDPVVGNWAKPAV